MDSLPRKEREKLAREDDIIFAAEKVFGLRGYDSASMDDIAREAQFTKKTLYTYFESKEDLFFAVVLKGFRKLLSCLRQAYENEETGFMKIKKACLNYYAFFRENPEMMRIMGSVGYVRQHAEGNTNLDGFVKINNDLFQSVADAIEEGKSDGSVSKSLETQKTAYSLIFLITGLFNQLSATGETFTSHFSLDIEAFSLYSLELILGTLKGMNQK